MIQTQDEQEEDGKQELLNKGQKEERNRKRKIQSEMEKGEKQCIRKP